MKFSFKIAGMVLAGAMLTGVAACGSSGGGNGDVAEVEYGYYTPTTHVFVYYLVPKTVYVTHSYYVSHSTLFANPSHHTYTAPRSAPKTTTRTTVTRKTGGVSLTKRR